MTERQPLDDIDVKILSELQKDGRVRNNELASRVGISEPPCLRRVRSLRSRGVIKAISATLDERLLGYEVISFVSIQLVSQTPAMMQAFETAVDAIPLHPAVLADFGRGRLSAEMRRARRRGDAPAATSVHRHAGGPHHQKLSRAGRRQGCAAADTGRGLTLAAPGGIVPSASRARRAGTQNCRHRQPAGGPKPSVRSPDRRCPCARNRRSRLPWCRSEG